MATLLSPPNTVMAVVSESHRFPFSPIYQIAMDTTEVSIFNYKARTILTILYHLSAKTQEIFGAFIYLLSIWYVYLSIPKGHASRDALWV
jgi:hypothetical protein